MNVAPGEMKITYPVQRLQIERALVILGKQQRATWRFYRFLTGAYQVFAITLALLSLAPVLKGMLSASGFDVLLGILFLFFIPTGLIFMIAFLSGLPLMGIQWWFSRRLSKLGLNEVGEMPASTLKTRFPQILGALGSVIGVFFLMMFIILFVGPAVDPGFFIERHWSTNDRLIIQGLCLGIGLLLTVPHFISRRRQSRTLMSRIDGLRHKLSEHLSDTSAGETVDIPVEDLNLMARIEEAQIERDRAEAIADARREARPDDYGLLNSRRTMEAISRLEPEVRVRVQEQAAALTRVTQPANATWDESAGMWRLTVPDTNVQMSYLVDKEKHQIKVISVQGARGTSVKC